MIASALIMVYPLRTDLSPSKLNKQIEPNEEIDLKNNEKRRDFDPISVSSFREAEQVSNVQ